LRELRSWVIWRPFRVYKYGKFVLFDSQHGNTGSAIR
jgi:hypothetical protein